jgi:Mitochondrial ATPase expression/Pentatricopeptide repeat domain
VRASRNSFAQRASSSFNGSYYADDNGFQTSWSAANHAAQNDFQGDNIRSVDREVPQASLTTGLEDMIQDYHPQAVLFALEDPSRGGHFIRFADNATFSQVFCALDPTYLIEPYIALYRNLDPDLHVNMKFRLSRSLEDRWESYLSSLDRIMGKRREAGHSLSLDVFRHLLRCAGIMGDEQLAKDVFETLMVEEKVDPDLQCYNNYLKARVRSSWAEVKFRNRTRVIQSNIDFRKHAGGTRRKRQQERKGFSPQRLHPSSPDSARTAALKTFEQLSSRGFTGDEETYTSLMLALSQANDLSAVKSILKSVWNVDVDQLLQYDEEEVESPTFYEEGSPLRPTGLLLATILDAFANHNDVSLAYTLLDYVSRNYNLKVPEDVWFRLFEMTFVLTCKRHWGPGAYKYAARREYNLGQLNKDTLRKFFDLITDEPHNLKPGVVMMIMMARIERDYRHLDSCVEYLRRAISILDQEKTGLSLLYDEILGMVQDSASTSGYLSSHFLEKRQQFIHTSMHVEKSLQYTQRMVYHLLHEGEWAGGGKMTELSSRRIPNMVKEFDSFMPNILNYHTPTGRVRFEDGYMHREYAIQLADDHFHVRVGRVRQLLDTDDYHELVSNIQSLPHLLAKRDNWCFWCKKDGHHERDCTTIHHFLAGAKASGKSPTSRVADTTTPMDHGSLDPDPGEEHVLAQPWDSPLEDMESEGAERLVNHSYAALTYGNEAPNATREREQFPTPRLNDLSPNKLPTTLDNRNQRSGATTIQEADSRVVREWEDVEDPYAFMDDESQGLRGNTELEGADENFDVPLVRVDENGQEPDDSPSREQTDLNTLCKDSGLELSEVLGATIDVDLGPKETGEEVVRDGPYADVPNHKISPDNRPSVEQERDDTENEIFSDDPQSAAVKEVPELDAVEDVELRSSNELGKSDSDDLYAFMSEDLKDVHADQTQRRSSIRRLTLNHPSSDTLHDAQTLNQRTTHLVVNAEGKQDKFTADYASTDTRHSNIRSMEISARARLSEAYPHTLILRYSSSDLVTMRPDQLIIGGRKKIGNRDARTRVREGRLKDLVFRYPAPSQKAMAKSVASDYLSTYISSEPQPLQRKAGRKGLNELSVRIKRFAHGVFMSRVWLVNLAENRADKSTTTSALPLTYLSMKIKSLAYDLSRSRLEVLRLKRNGKNERAVAEDMPLEHLAPKIKQFARELPRSRGKVLRVKEKGKKESIISTAASLEHLPAKIRSFWHDLAESRLQVVRLRETGKDKNTILRVLSKTRVRVKPKPKPKKAKPRVRKAEKTVKSRIRSEAKWKPNVSKRKTKAEPQPPLQETYKTRSESKQTPSWTRKKVQKPESPAKLDDSNLKFISLDREI